MHLKSIIKLLLAIAQLATVAKASYIWVPDEEEGLTDSPDLFQDPNTTNNESFQSDLVGGDSTFSSGSFYPTDVEGDAEEDGPLDSAADSGDYLGESLFDEGSEEADLVFQTDRSKRNKDKKKQKCRNNGGSGSGSGGGSGVGSAVLKSLGTVWSLQLPISGTSSAGNMLTIDPGKVTSYSKPGIFEATSNALVMTVNVDEVTKIGPGKSPNSKYYRTELRQGTGSYPGFSLADAKLRTLEITFSVDQLTNAPSGVVVAQIHGAGPLPNMELKVRPDGQVIPEDHKNQRGVDVSKNPRLATGYKLGSKVTIKIVAGNGKIEFWYNGVLNPAATITGRYPGQYWKTGTYCQSNVPGAICKVSFYSIKFSG